MPKDKRVVAMGDMHAGHKWALVPPEYQTYKEKSVQSKLWKWFAAKARSIGPVDVLILTGDMIDGDGAKNGGVELITPDCFEQAAIAIRCAEMLHPKAVQVVAGTPYHVGQREQFEQIIANHFNAPFVLDLDCYIGPYRFDVRHHTGNSGVPYSRGSAARKELMWRLIDSAIDGENKPDVLIRSHVHYFTAIQDSMGLTFTTPCLQLNSAYGKLRCQGRTDVGFLELLVPNSKKDPIKWCAHLLANSNIRNPPVIL